MYQYRLSYMNIAHLLDNTLLPNTYTSYHPIALPFQTLVHYPLSHTQID